MDETRTITYIDAEDEALEQEVKAALKSSMEENLLKYCKVLSAQLAMQGIDLKTHPVERTIYYMEK